MLFRSFGVNLEKVLASEDFAAGVEEPQATGVNKFIEEAAMLFECELSSASGVIAHGQVVVAMEALEGTPAREFDGHLERGAFALEALVNQARQIAVCCRFQFEPFAVPI